MSGIWEAVRSAGALDPRKLARFSDAKLALIATSACGSCGEIEEIDETIQWLKDLRSEAALAPKVDDKKRIEDWRQQCYLFTAKLEEAAQKEVVMETQAEHRAQKAQANYPTSSAVTSIVGGRCAANKRKTRDEDKRDSWAFEH